jgi:hypothetical protein
MPNIRIKDIPTTASATSSTDFIGIDGSANGTRKLNAFSPTFGGNLTVSGTALVNAPINVNAPALQVSSTDNDASGLYLKVRSSPGSANARNWAIWNNYNSAGNLDILRSTTNTGAPTTTAFSLDSSSNATLSGNLTVNGGQIALDASSSTPSVLVTQTDPAAYSLFRLRNTGGTAQSYDFAVGGSGTGSLAQKFYVYDGTAGAVRLAIAPTTGNLLLGTTTDSGNGKLQLADHTTSAGGIGFGPKTSLYRYGITTLGLQQNSGSYKPLYFYADVTNCGVFDTPAAEPNYSGIYFNSTANSATIATKGTVALTLDSSQNATFAGRTSAGTAYGTAKSVVINFNTSTAANVTRTFTVTMPSPNLASTFLLEVGVYGNSATGIGGLLVHGYGYFGSSSTYAVSEISKFSSGNVTISSVTKSNGSLTFTVLDTTDAAYVTVKYSQTSDASITTLPTITSA